MSLTYLLRNYLHLSHHLLKPLCLKAIQHVRDNFYLSHISHINYHITPMQPQHVTTNKHRDNVRDNVKDM